MPKPRGKVKTFHSEWTFRIGLKVSTQLNGMSTHACQYKTNQIFHEE